VKLNSLLLIGLSVFLSSCSSTSVDTRVKDEINTIKINAEEYSREMELKSDLDDKINKEVRQIRSDNIRMDKGDSQYRFDIKAERLSAKLFFVNLMEGTKKNIIVHPGVEGDINLSLKNVSLDEVLDVVRDIYGFDYQFKNNIYTVYSKKLRTEIFPINYIDVRRVGVSDTSVLTGNVESSTQSQYSNSAEKTDLVGNGNSINPGSRVQTRSETDFWASLHSSLVELIGVERNEEGQRKVVANPQTGVVVVTAMPNELAAVRNFLDKAQLSIKRQVIIEAKILEVKLNDGYQSGINWNEINGQLLLGNNVSSFSSPATINAVSEGVGEIFSSLLRISDVSRLLSLLKTQGDLQVLSSPRVSTVNNQKAVIRVGSDQFFVTGISNSTTTSSGSTTNNPDVELSSFFSGISLDVTPQIDDKGDVILHIHPVVSTVTEEQKNIAIGDSSFSLPLALRDIRESDSIVHAANGQVVVLGGLMQERSLNNTGKRPGLGEVPVVNSLFKTRSAATEKSELIILLKPIVVDQNSWVNDISASQKRMNQLTH